MRIVLFLLFVSAPVYFYCQRFDMRCCCAGRGKKVDGVSLIVRVLIYVLGFCL